MGDDAEEPCHSFLRAHVEPGHNQCFLCCILIHTNKRKNVGDEKKIERSIIIHVTSNLVSYLNSLDPALICEQVTPREHDVRADPMYALVLAHYDCQVLTVAILSAPSHPFLFQMLVEYFQRC